MNPKKRKHQESWQEKDARWEETHPDWEQDRDAEYEKEKEKLMRRDELTAFNHALERARRMDACRRDQLTAPPAWTQATSADIAAVAVFVHEGIRNLKDQQAQYEASLKLGSTEIQGGADQLGGFGNAWHANCQLNPELSVPVPHPIACTGAARTRRAHREFAVAAGTTNPHKEGLKCAERQLRQCQSRAKSNDICFAAKTKVRNYHYKVGLWDHQQTNLEGTEFLTEFAKQSIAAAAEEYATSKFSEGPG